MPGTTWNILPRKTCSCPMSVMPKHTQVIGMYTHTKRRHSSFPGTFSSTAITPSASNCRSITMASHRSIPHIRKLPVLPCQTDVSIHTASRWHTVRYSPLRFPPRGMYTYFRNHPPRVICHLR